MRPRHSLIVCFQETQMIDIAGPCSRDGYALQEAESESPMEIRAPCNGVSERKRTDLGNRLGEAQLEIEVAVKAFCPDAAISVYDHNSSSSLEELT